jgi:hypothetical protein
MAELADHLENQKVKWRIGWRSLADRVYAMFRHGPPFPRQGFRAAAR